MGFEVPPNYRRYADVLMRIGEFRPAGSKVQFRCVFPHRHKHGDRNWSGWAYLGDAGNLIANCKGCGATWQEIVAEVGLPASAWWPRPLGKDRRMDGPKPKLVESYPYTDRHGELIAVKDRFEPGFHGRAKDFVWRRPLPAKLFRHFNIPPGSEAWVRGLDAMEVCVQKSWEAGGVRHYRLGPVAEHRTAAAAQVEGRGVSLYRLADLAAAGPRAPVLVVEGERKADRLTAIGFTAVSGPAGKGRWEWAWGAEFEGRRVVAVPDREPGAGDVTAREWCAKVLGSAMDYGAASARMVVIPYGELLPDNAGGDVVDWLARRFPGVDWAKPLPDGERKAMADAVAELCRRSPEYRGPATKAA